MTKADYFTKISNGIMEAIPYYKFNGTQLRIMFVVLRYTYGFSRDEYSLSLSFISRATGANKEQVKRELKALIEADVVKVVQEASFSSARIIALNKQHKEWRIAACKPISPQVADLPPGSEKVCPQVADLPPGSEKVCPQVADLPPPPGSGLDPQERKKKENSKEKTYSISAQKILSVWNGEKIIKHTMTEEMSQAIDVATQKHGIDKIIQSIRRYSKIYHDSDYFFSYKWTLINFLNRKRGLSDFLDGGEKWENYLARGQPKNKESSVDDLGDPVPGALDRTPL